MYVSNLAQKTGLTLALASALTVTACGGSAHNSTADENAENSSSAAGEVQVFAAASLNDAGAELEKAFEESNPGVDISFNYAGSSKLVQQMEQGATPDLLITADQKTMDEARGSVAELENVTPKVIATNSLVLATSADNPAQISTVSDLSSPEVTTAICAEEVPCGNLAHQELSAHKITLGNATEEQNVSDVATKVSSGAVDAGFIYSTDAATIKKDQNITEIELTDLEKNQYPMAVTTGGANNPEAEKFAQWLTSDAAQKILSSYGFGSAD